MILNGVLTVIDLIDNAAEKSEKDRANIYVLVFNLKKVNDLNAAKIFNNALSSLLILLYNVFVCLDLRPL